MRRILIEVDDDLTELIDKEARDSQRTRKSQVTFIVKSYYKQGLTKIEKDKGTLTEDSFKY
jgi:hypothetical protein